LKWKILGFIKISLFYVYKIDNTYLKISQNQNYKDGKKGNMFITALVKDINESSYWNNKVLARSWMVEEKYPNAKLIPCRLCEMR